LKVDRLVGLAWLNLILVLAMDLAYALFTYEVARHFLVFIAALLVSTTLSSVMLLYLSVNWAGAGRRARAFGALRGWKIDIQEAKRELRGGRG